jgi:peptidoglycan L-alanyl-D-glutamate endopeptidase CwlK
MTSRSLDVLDPILRGQAQQLIMNCKARGVDMLVTCTVRDCAEQAKLYRQSRGKFEIDTKAASLRERGFGFLADVLESVGPQFGALGRHVTNAGPGESWHQYGKAFDAVPIVNGKAMWDDRHPGWAVYGEEAQKLGLIWAGTWVTFKEFPHCQSVPAGNPLKALRPDEAKLAMTTSGAMNA